MSHDHTQGTALLSAANAILTMLSIHLVKAGRATDCLSGEPAPASPLLLQVTLNQCLTSLEAYLPDQQ